MNKYFLVGIIITVIVTIIIVVTTNGFTPRPGVYPDVDGFKEYKVTDNSHMSEKQFMGGSYEDFIKNMALEDSVSKSHDEFIKNMDGTTQTASKDSVMDNFNPPVPFWGLPRAAHYAKIGADSDARTVQSETIDQAIDFAMHNNNSYRL